MGTPKNVVIVGGVAGGASAAARLRRLDETANIVLLERGDHVSFANCGLPYLIGGEIEERDELLIQTPAALKRRFRLDVRVRHEALSIDRTKRLVRVKDLDKSEEYDLPYDALVLSPGAAAWVPPFPGHDLPGVRTLRNLKDMDAIKAAVDGRPAGRALLLGAGFIGLEMAEALRHKGWEVLLADKAAQVLAPADPDMAIYVQRALAANGVVTLLNADLKGIAAVGGRLEADFGGRSESVDLALVAIGVRPEASLARSAGLALGASGGIRVDPNMRTDDPAIYAVGDAVEVTMPVTGRQGLAPLAGPANRQGRIAAENICGIPSTYGGTYGTAIVRVFDTTFALTGATEKSLKSAGRIFSKIYLHPSHHAGYYPGAEQMHLKVLFDPNSGELLGAQAAGPAGVDKRMDVLATALKARMSVRDLAELELSYAPPFGSAKDPVNFAGFIATNVLDGRMGLASPEDFAAPQPGQLLLDVRTPSEFAEGSIPGSINIPVDALRSRIGELPREKELLVTCRVGLRGYIATRILDQAGYKTRNLSGGWLTWEAWTEARKDI
jgi:NADPH-dependent 2,4-dienoyl-CoA reductase/sulfur reductase-like enzyme/rhodanese-related sulfurtransferase